MTSPPMKLLASMLIVSAALAGCLAEGGGVDGEQTEQESSTTYVDILDFSRKLDQGSVVRPDSTT